MRVSVGRRRGVRMRSIIIGALLAAGLSTAPAQAQPVVDEKRCPQFEQMFRAYGLPVKQFSFIAWRESKCVTRAVGWNYHPGKGPRDCKSGRFDEHRKCAAVRSYDVGLLQINSSWRTVTRQLCAFGQTSVDMRVLKDLGCNLRVAKYLYDNGGLVHWAVPARSPRVPVGHASVGGERGGTGNCPAELPSGESAKCHNRTETK